MNPYAAFGVFVLGFASGLLAFVFGGLLGDWLRDRRLAAEEQERQVQRNQYRTDMHAHLMAELLRRSHGHAARKEYLQ